MTGEHAEIVCGEWHSMNETSGVEDYNIVLPIESIVRHPEYEIVRGDGNTQFVTADLAVFKVDDTQLKNTKQKVYPACLPKYDDDEQSYALHSGWSSAPPDDFLQNTLNLDDTNGFYNHRYEFRKMWHYNMSIKTCKDPDKEPNADYSYQYPTNSYYPKATICATDIENKFCPTSGESGSPLMSKKSGRFEATGIQSFTKGKVNVLTLLL